MQGQRAAIGSGRRRESVTLGRVAAWSGFGGAACGQAGLLAGGYFLLGYLLVDAAGPNALRDAALAASLTLLGIAVMVIARRAGNRAAARGTDLGRLPLRLAAEADQDFAGEGRRPAA
jgi:hypothetical protein